MRREWAVALLLLLAAIAAGRSASSQTVTLDMHDVTIKEVTDELQEQTGYRFHFMGQGGADAWPATIPELRATDRPFKEVLREACKSAGFRYRRAGGGMFYLEVGSFQESPHLASVEGYRLSVNAVRFSEGARSMDFINAPGETRHSPPNLNLTLGLDAPTGEDGARVRGLEGLSICDDRDRVFGMDETGAQSYLREHFRLNPGPDWGTIAVQFDDVALDATSLKYLAGALVLSESLETVEVRFDDLEEGAVQEVEGGFTVKVSRLEVTDGHLNLNLDMSVPQGMDWQERQRWSRSQMELLFDDGSVHRADLSSAWGSAGFGIGWGREQKNPVAIIYRAYRPSDEQRLVPFRIENIPLPR